VTSALRITALLTRCRARAGCLLLLAERRPAWSGRWGARLLAGTSVAAELELEELSTERLTTIAADSKIRPLLIAGSTLAPTELLEIAQDNPDLARAARQCLLRAESVSLSGALYGAIVLDRAGSAQRLTFAMGVAGAAAGRLVPQEARAIFERCLEILQRPIDPYEAMSAGIRGAANQLASAVLAQDSSLDTVAIARLNTTGLRPNLEALAGSALKESPDQAGTRFLEYLTAFAPTPEQAVRFAEDCDADRGAMREISRPTRSHLRRLQHSPGQRRSDRTALAAGVGLPTVVAVGLAFAARHVSSGLAGAGVGPGVAVGALAVVATVHVLSVQLAAQRLPGPIAIGAALRPAAIAAYVTVGLILVASILGQEHAPPAWHPALVATGLLLVLIVLVVGLTSSSLRATTIAEASDRIARRRLRQARRTGRRAGRLHHAAVEMRAVADRFGCLRIFMAPEEATVRYPIRADEVGFVHVDSQRLEQTARRPMWQDGRVRLDLVLLPGAPVAPGEEMGSLVPSVAVALTNEEILVAESIFAVSVERDLERFGELCVALCTQVGVCARGGDPGGARRIVSALAALLDAHLQADAKTRGTAEGTTPLSPVVIQLAEQAAAALKEANTEVERELVARLIGRVLANARKDDGLVALFAFKVGDAASNLSQFGVLYAAGCRAALIDSNLELLTVQNTFRQLVVGASDTARYANETSGRLVLFCAAAAPRVSRAVWTRWRQAAEAAPVGDRHLIASRIGAGALPVGNLSLAVEIAIDMADADFPALLERAHTEEAATFENMISTYYGRLLGTDAESKIAAFLEVLTE